VTKGRRWSRATASPLPRFFAVPRLVGRAGGAGHGAESVAAVIAALDEQGRWRSASGHDEPSVPKTRIDEAAAGDYARTLVGDETDTSPWRDESVVGISTAVFIRNMGTLIRALEGAR
jgi:hypothetical protein